jgi:hypothetical protein
MNQPYEKIPELRRGLTTLKWKIRRRNQEAHPSHGLNSTFLHKFKFNTSTLTYPKLG